MVSFATITQCISIPTVLEFISKMCNAIYCQLDCQPLHQLTRLRSYISLRNDLYCVGCGVKLSLTLNLQVDRSLNRYANSWLKAPSWLNTCDMLQLTFKDIYILCTSIVLIIHHTGSCCCMRRQSNIDSPSLRCSMTLASERRYSRMWVAKSSTRRVVRYGVKSTSFALHIQTSKLHSNTVIHSSSFTATVTTTVCSTTVQSKSILVCLLTPGLHRSVRATASVVDGRHRVGRILK